MNTEPIRAPYEILNYGPDGVVVIIADGIPQAAPTLADGLRFLMSEGVEIHAEHLSVAAALGVGVSAVADVPPVLCGACSDDLGDPGEWADAVRELDPADRIPCEGCGA